MFLIVFRELFMLFVALVLLYIVVRMIVKVFKRDSRRVRLEEAKENITETLEEAKSVPEVEVRKLQQARTKINELIKEGEKNKGE